MTKGVDPSIAANNFADTANSVADALAPNSAEHPYLAIGVLGLTAVAMALERRTYDRTPDQDAAIASNPALVDHAATLAGIKRDPAQRAKEVRRQRLWPTMGATFGAGVIAFGVAGGFSDETKVSDTDGKSVAVLDSSYSMRHAADLGSDQTRYGAAVEGLRESGHRGRVAVMDSGTRALIRIPMGAGWREHLIDLRRQAVDPSQGQLAEAIGDAISELPITRDEKGETNRTGSVLVVSDGSIDSEPEEISEVAARARNIGVNINVVVPGTSTGSYRVDGSAPIPSRVQPQAFSAFGNENVKLASNEEEVKQAVEASLAEGTSTETERTGWKLPLWLGGIITALSLAKMSSNSITRKV